MLTDLLRSEGISQLFRRLTGENTLTVSSTSVENFLRNLLQLAQESVSVFILPGAASILLGTFLQHAPEHFFGNRNLLRALAASGPMAVALSLATFPAELALLLAATAWSLHAREVFQAAVGQMKASELRRSVPYHFHHHHHHQQQQQQQQLYQRPLRPSMATTAISAIWVEGFCRQHARLLVDLVALNGRLASPLIIAFYLPVLIFSIYNLCLLYFLQWNAVETLSLLVTFLGIALTFCLLFLLSTVVWALYSGPGGQRYSAQMKCGTGRGGTAAGHFDTAVLRTKLKLMAYHEVLCTEKKVCFTFGSLSKVEYRWLGEVSEVLG
ncbi:hypothetical protein TYRP_011629 [Tyrophagus putrescentiae]|nr:hypothetical protein TYRP_011629 [Tyrophagus putrescentiae]